MAYRNDPYDDPMIDEVHSFRSSRYLLGVLALIGVAVGVAMIVYGFVVAAT